MEQSGSWRLGSDGGSLDRGCSKCELEDGPPLKSLGGKQRVSELLMAQRMIIQLSYVDILGKVTPERLKTQATQARGVLFIMFFFFFNSTSTYIGPYHYFLCVFVFSGMGPSLYISVSLYYIPYDLFPILIPSISQLTQFLFSCV